MAEKLILPTEVKVCATCSFWDGERRVDPEMKVVVVAHECHGECLVQAEEKPAMRDTRLESACIWEDLEPDQPEQIEAMATQVAGAESEKERLAG